MEIKNLTFSFPKNPGEILFKNLSLKIDPHQISVFLGPSGCGKSTLLRVLAGLQKVNQGAYLYESSDASFVFQEANLLEWKRITENIMLPFLLARKKPEMEFFNQIVKMLKIADCLSKYPSELSGGQKMRVSIARALITRPQVLFMDEPFSALDEPTRLSLQDELKTIQKTFKMTVLFVTHSFYEAVYLGDRLLIFAGDRPASFIYDQRSEQAFTNRFDPVYQKKVQEISCYFLNEKGLA